MSNGYQIDFLSFTLKTGHVPRAVKLLSGFDLKAQEKGLYGYKFSYVAPGVRLLFSPDRDDVHVQLSGRGCDVFDCLQLPDDAHVTRLDIAFDSFDGYYTSEDVWGCLQRGSTSGTCRSKTGYMGFDGKDSGRTIYIGSAKSDIRLRIYDKAAEQGITPLQRLGYVDWTRYELQIRNDNASAVYQQIIAMVRSGNDEQSVLACNFASVLRPLFFVCESAEYVHKCKKDKIVCLPCPRWLSMFSAYDFKRPRPLRKSPTLTNLTRYVLGAASAFKALSLVFPAFDEIFSEKVEQISFSEKHEELLIDFAPVYLDNEQAEIAFYGHPF